MKKPLKITLWTVGALIGLILIAAIILVASFDPNKYKGEIMYAVKTATGRDLKIDGKISLSLFPWLGVKMEGLTLGNATGFGPEPFVKIGSAGASVSLLPLLAGNVRVDTVHVDDLTLNLATDANGRNNWSDLGGAQKTAAKPAASAEKPAKPADRKSTRLNSSH